MFEGVQMLDLFRESPIMSVLLICSIIAFTFAIERWWFFRRNRINVPKFMERVKEFLRRNELDRLFGYCERKRGPVPRMIHTALTNLSLPKEEMERLLDTTKEKEEVKFEKNLSILGTLSNIAPLLGLFGTVLGIIRAFRDIAVTGSGGSAVVAMGVAEALLTTAAGIIIAVVSTIFYNYFMRRIRVMDVETEDMRVNLWPMLREAGNHNVQR
ncbi:MAG: MotA/TolQ/ExbB proton channel family protein [Candidatus Latescibacteria bacterium]|nr:MotA/TolQ/ExbB proton channel family protein [Candidatus Latescibacterota bacterium]